MVNGSECITDEELKSSALFADYDLRVDDDEFIGTYNDVDFKITETEFCKIYQTKNGQRQKSVFKGINVKYLSYLLTIVFFSLYGSYKPVLGIIVYHRFGKLTVTVSVRAFQIFL